MWLPIIIYVGSVVGLILAATLAGKEKETKTVVIKEKKEKQYDA